MTDKNTILKTYFGHINFREGQEQIIDSILSGRDALCVMPTGAGKSICYQIPALIFPGITLVISPLISLMKDQVMALVQNGIAAAYINSSLTQLQYEKVLFNVSCGKYKIVYVAPERLLAPEFTEICENTAISFMAIDEAHCISQWGQDFRPSYLKITDFINLLPHRPVIGAFTATATDTVKNDIENNLKLNAPFKITTGFDRPNLFFSVVKPESKTKKLIELLKERKHKFGIVYCSTRKNVEDVCDLLNANGFSASRYHAGLSDAERKQNQEDFIYDRVQIMVATNAFGMGIDKSNVSFVIHYNMPKNLESYYQEAGRAGRDGEKADCILLYSPGDVHTNQFLIYHSENNPELSKEEQEQVKQKDIERLRQMTFYSTTNECLRSFILRYFGDKATNYCGNCSNCLTQFDTIDITVDAQKIISCIIRTGNRYGKKIICDILRGSKNEKLIKLGLDKQTTYGIMSDYPENKLRNIIDFLETNGYLSVCGNEYPVVITTPKVDAVLYGGTPLSMKMAKPKVVSPQKAKNMREQEITDSGLFAKLRKLRKTIAEEHHVPPYVIFADSVLIDMCRKHPTTPDEFLAVSGVGNTKLKLYGEQFIELIKQSPNTDNISIPESKNANDDSVDIADAERERIGYFPWTNEEITQLKEEVEAGFIIRKIAVKHNRTNGAIRSRIKKEGFGGNDDNGTN